VPKEYITFVVGKGRKNIEKIETKSGTKIIVPSRRNSEGRLIIIPL
jgi:predicted PilT family ATPase